MNTKRIIQRIVFVTFTLAACTGLLVLLVAAIGKKNRERCRDYVIKINGPQNNISAGCCAFIAEKDVLKIITGATDGHVKGAPIADFNLRKLEQVLKDNAWIKTANLYFDNREVLHISVTENEPIARIFTTIGKSFYINSDAMQMPLSDKVSARVPVFTNFPNKRILSDKDSVLLNDIKKTSQFILNDPFWMAQTEQIDITEHRTFEMVPTIGNHIVKLGTGDDIDKKFHRLLVFYQQVLSKTSFDKYNFIDVQYAGQVIGTRDKISKVDSMQLKKNIEKLLREAKEMQKDTTTVLPVTEKEIATTVQVNSTPLKRPTTAKPKLIVDKEAKKPKAVMPKKDA
jgi:cell division protein FtsQ